MFVPAVLRTGLVKTTTIRGFSTSSRLCLATASQTKANALAKSSSAWSERLSSSRLNRYLVVAEDYKDAGANSRRLEVRERHLEEAQKGKLLGRVELAGALLNKDFSEIDEELGPGPIMGGSVMIVLGESIEDVRARVAQDEYSKGRVWDSSNIKVYPFLQARLASAAANEAADTTGIDVSRDQDPSLSLGQLRQDMAQGKGHTIITLGALRKMHKQAGPQTNE